MADSEKTSASSASKPAEKENKQSFFKGVKAEFKKIIWPNREELTKQTIAVIVISVLTGVIIAVLDMVLQYGLNAIVK